jgi:hypothetical protein
MKFLRVITVEKNFKPVMCGTIYTYRDKHGNEKFVADRTVDGTDFEFFSPGAAELWLKLGGMLHG